MSKPADRWGGATLSHPEETNIRSGDIRSADIRSAHIRSTNIRASDIGFLIAGIRARIPDIDFDTPEIPIRTPHVFVPNIDFDTEPEFELLMKNGRPLGRARHAPTAARRDGRFRARQHQSKDSETIVEVKRHGRSVGLPELRMLLGLPPFAGPIDPAQVMIPEIGLRILPFIVPKKLRDAVTGDLTEDFRTFAAR